MTPVDELSDKALCASKAAHATHSEDAHRDAAKAHRAAYQAAESSSRPSLAATHLQQAAAHDRHVDPTTAEGKQSAAWRATAEARQSSKAADHRAAADAHRDAAGHEDADRVANGKHMSEAFRHDNEADRLERPGTAGGPNLLRMLG
jgi:hypothetical protein